MEAGFILIEDVFVDDNLMSFEHIMSTNKIPKKDFWKYLQLRSCIMTTQRKLSLIPQTVVQQIFQANEPTKGGASRFYSLMRQSHPMKLSGLKRAWEEDLEGEINDEMWKEITGSWYKTSREVQTQFITYRIIHRGYCIPCKMARLKL